MLKFTHTICVLFFELVFSTENQWPIAELTLGKINGYYKESYSGNIYSAFEGIPYAKPPIGKLRFKDPEPSEGWRGEWNATVSHECIQLNPYTFKVDGQEDCLYLNVYVPRKTVQPNENLDVIVYIHGGGFMYLSPSLGGPYFIMDKHVIYVSVNYRLGIMGFLSTQDDVVPGNMGMKDQVAALKWIQTHISKFGGNPNSVTLLGLSAGGAAVHFHYFSLLSRGLFHKGISQSGTALVPWAIQEAPLEKSRKLAMLAGCNFKETKKFVECLQERPARHLAQLTQKFFAFYDFPLAPFAPVVEKQTEKAFLSKSPYQMMKAKEVYDVPWITSITNNEGLFPTLKLLDKLDVIKNNWNEILPHLLEFNYTVASHMKASVSQKIKAYYFSDQDVSLENAQSLINLFSDRYFAVGFELAAKLQAKANKSPVYAYIYNHSGEFTLSKFFKQNKNYGVGHGEDGFLLHDVTLFGNTLENQELSKEDEEIKNVLVDIVTSFAKQDIPTIKYCEWPALSGRDNLSYLSIETAGNIKMKSNSEIAPLQFWHSLPILEQGEIKVNEEL